VTSNEKAAEHVFRSLRHSSATKHILGSQSLANDDQTSRTLVWGLVDGR